MKPRQLAAMLFVVLAAVAALGLLASTVTHLASLMGARLPMRAMFALHAGVFVVWAPFVVSGLVLRATGTTVEGFPAWWRGAFRWSLAYFVLHFALAVAAMVLAPDEPADPSGFPPFVGRVFSVGWIVFYGTATVGFAAFGASVLGKA